MRTSTSTLRAPAAAALLLLLLPPAAADAYVSGCDGAPDGPAACNFPSKICYDLGSYGKICVGHGPTYCATRSGQHYCCAEPSPQYWQGQLLGEDCLKSDAPEETPVMPEMSDTLAALFVLAATALALYLRGRHPTGAA